MLLRIARITSDRDEVVILRELDVAPRQYWNVALELCLWWRTSIHLSFMFMANLMLRFYLSGASAANEMNRMSSGCYGNSILGLPNL